MINYCLFRNKELNSLVCLKVKVRKNKEIRERTNDLYY